MATRRPGFSPTARRDLLLTVGQSTDQWGASQATRYRRALEQTCDRLAEYPEMGRGHPELDNVRTFPSQQHRILYRPTFDGVLILLVIHQRMRLTDVGLE